jgi:hypothetical protein
VDRKLAVAAVKNHAGRFVTPSSATAAMAAQDLAGLSAINDFQVSPGRHHRQRRLPDQHLRLPDGLPTPVRHRQGHHAASAPALHDRRGQASAVCAPLPPPLRKLITAKLQLLTGPTATPLT